MRARYFDPSIGRFISRDPVEGDLMNPQTQNGYNFTNGDPINLSDPSGEAVYNNSDQAVLIKLENENTDEYNWLPAKTNDPRPQDGVIFSNDSIYKNGTGVDVMVTNNGVYTVNGTRELLNNAVKAVLNAAGTPRDYSGTYKLNDGSITGNAWKPNVCW
jgi:hypothetical protein